MPVAVLGEMFEPLQVDVAAHVVAENQRWQRDGREGGFAVAEKKTDVGFHIGAVVHRVAQLFSLLDKRQGALFYRQLQRIDLRIDRNQVKRLDQLHRIAADQHINGFAFALFRSAGEALEISPHHLFLQEMHLSLVAGFCVIGGLWHVYLRSVSGLASRVSGCNARLTTRDTRRGF